MQLRPVLVALLGTTAFAWPLPRDETFSVRCEHPSIDPNGPPYTPIVHWQSPPNEDDCCRAIDDGAANGIFHASRKHATVNFNSCIVGILRGDDAEPPPFGDVAKHAKRAVRTVLEGCGSGRGEYRSDGWTFGVGTMMAPFMGIADHFDGPENPREGLDDDV